MDADTAAAVDRWVDEYERDSRGRFTATDRSVPTDADFDNLFPPATYAEADRRFVAAAARADAAGELTDDELYLSIFGPEPEPNTPLPPLERPYAKPYGAPVAASAASQGDGLDLSKWAGSAAYS